MVAPTLCALSLSQGLRNLRSHTSLVCVASVCAIILAVTVTSLGQKKTSGPAIRFTEKPAQEAQDAIKLAFQIVGASDQRVRVLLDGQKDHVVSKEISLSTKGEHVISVNLFEGTNKITFIVFVNDDPQTMSDQSIEVNCAGRWCKKPFGLPSESVASEIGASLPAQGGSNSGQSGRKPEQSTGSDSDTSEKTDNVTIKPVEVKDGVANTLFVVKKSSKIQQLTVVVYSPDNHIVDSKSPVTLTEVGDALIGNASLKLATGKNVIRAIDLDKPREKANEALADVDCSGEKCIKSAVEESATAKPTVITVDRPKDDKTVESSFLDAYLTVAKDSKIKKLRYYVLHEGKTVVNTDDVPDTEVTYEDGKDGTARVPIKVVKDENLVTFIDADDPNNLEHQTSLKVICKGPNCATDFKIATLPSNSRFMRAIVGMEQAGASSAESKTNPFLDFFFSSPLRFTTKRVEVPLLNPDGSQQRGANGKPLTKWKELKDPLPRFGTWGQVRFSTTPEQTSSFAVLPSSFVNQVSDPTKAVDLVQSFDFLAGVEYRAFNANGWSWTLIPGVKQKTSLYLTFGGGAISPLAVKRESAQLFTIPADAVAATTTSPAVPADPRRAEFIRRFGDPKTLTYVGFVPLERDRFFRQYYLGLRLKTNYCEDTNCYRYMNRFPSIVDFAIGQNEAVTGGRLKAEVRDAANNLIGRRRSWVMRLDAFFPLPFREANFLYLYGTALMKIGGGGVKIQDPLFLESPGTTIKITDPSVYLPPPDLQPTRIDRDYYKIGIGVNLTDLFNRNKTPPH